MTAEQFTPSDTDISTFDVAANMAALQTADPCYRRWVVVGR